MVEAQKPAPKVAGRAAFALMIARDVALPLGLFYGLRAFGASQWLALVAGAAVPLAAAVIIAIRQRRVEKAGLFTLTLLGVGTLAGLFTADPRLLVARESYLTAVVGGWILVTVVTARPLLYTATVKFMPAETAESWERAWDTDPTFRRTLKAMTIAWGMAFLLDAAARVVMAYTLPLDLVPVLSVVLLVVMLAAVVEGGKAYGRRHRPSRGAVPEPAQET